MSAILLIWFAGGPRPKPLRDGSPQLRRIEFNIGSLERQGTFERLIYRVKGDTKADSIFTGPKDTYSYDPRTSNRTIPRYCATARSPLLHSAHLACPRNPVSIEPSLSRRTPSALRLYHRNPKRYITRGVSARGIGGGPSRPDTNLVGLQQRV